MNTNAIQQKLHQLSKEADAFEQEANLAVQEREVVQRKIAESKQRQAHLITELRTARELNAKYKDAIDAKLKEKSRLVLSLKTEQEAAKQLAMQLRNADKKDTKEKQDYHEFINSVTQQLEENLYEQYYLRLQKQLTPDSINALVEYVRTKSPGEDQDLVKQILEILPKVENSYADYQKSLEMKSVFEQKLDGVRNKSGFSTAEQEKLEQDWGRQVSHETSNIETGLFYTE